MPRFTFRRFCLVLAVLEVLIALFYLAKNDRPFLIGDCPYYVAGTRSLIADGDWDIRNQLEGDLKDHEGFFAVSIDNRVVPKHSVLLTLLAVPFDAVAGEKGLLLLNLLLVFALATGIARLAGGGPTACLLTLAGYLSSPLLPYTYNFSPDVLGTALLIWAYVAAIGGRSALAGALVGLAVWAKVYLLLLALPLALIILPKGVRATGISIAFGLIALSPMLSLQWQLFGSPFVTGYDRDARVTAAGFEFSPSHSTRFNQEFFPGLGHLLFDERIGMLRTAPLWFLWPIGLAIGWREADNRRRRELLALALALVINLVFFARYDEWDASAFGNRFLFPALAIGLALQEPLWRRLARTTD
jgi:hypothetical protein